MDNIDRQKRNSMPEKILQSLESVSETLLMTLYVRARESQRIDGMIKDEQAVAMVNQLECGFSRLRMQRHDEIAVIMRLRRFDNYVRDFLARNPDAVVVHIGCGLDTRFGRVDNGRVEWFDLDLPDVMVLRQKLIGNEDNRYHALATSVFDDDWFKAVSQYKPRSFMFVAEGVFPYFEEAQVKSLFLKLRDHFPGSELVCDAHTPFVIWADNLHLAFAGVKARLHWRLRHAKDVESWGSGICLLDEWNYFEEDDAHLKAFRWVRLFPPLAKSSGIFHYRLG
jgi:O-methyltransferase involved in polyketide biosynthesis